MRAALLLSPSSITQGRMGASKAALILIGHNSMFQKYFYSYSVASCNDLDDIAESSCVGMSDQEGWVYAVRKECPGNYSCNEICESQSLANQDPQVKNRKGVCEMALHVYADRPRLYDNRQLGPKVYRYRDCTSKGCGPNYCCCRFI